VKHNFVDRVLRKGVRVFSGEKSKPTAQDYLAEIQTPQAGNDFIRQALLSGKSFFAARIGSVELEVLENYAEIVCLQKLKSLERRFQIWMGVDPFWRQTVRRNIQLNAGFFPATDSMLERFSKEFIQHLTQVDMMGVWHNRYEDIAINTFCEKAKLTDLRALEPYYHKDPWSSALEGKTVLVVHPFDLSIRNQYNRFESIFPNQNVLVNFKLLTVKAVQTAAGSKTSFNSWFDALQCMMSEIDKLDFDVAIIGAGAYGLPLGAIIKSKRDKQVIHMGGATQILFGIKGSRWDNHPVISKFYNDAWVRPLEEEKPPLFQNVENGCYW
jgi:hypothetical protein